MESEFTAVGAESVDLAHDILCEFNGSDAGIVIPAIVVVLTELIGQLSSDQEEAKILANAILESVCESLKGFDELGYSSN